ncbi:MAG TPA: phage shock protein operon transcriptional activator [Candidatus Hydrogenedentes bacterium]|jgi:psp operon transcriptional activator|nr:phage shock protein operon transcriptional activator [Candidatus Hydrogenedentota bacterium]HPJ98964.1 phage shock protein operon transcriptional activator [Candidatus Hydrogenedentota bacterium]
MIEPHEGRRREDVEAAIPELVEALGQSEAFLAFQEHLSRAARVDRPVLILGERGTGKELAATRLHFLSLRWQHSFVALNCAALAPSLIESELFGHEAGAFTGATARRAGRFELAHQGTLFLDEIGLIPLETQEKILRAVEYGVFERVGGSRPVHVDVRIVGATNADLRTLVNAGRFRQDLLDRLSFEVLHLPPLRARQDDALLLANHFAARMAHELGWDDVPEFSDEALLALENYAWPGNVRELKNVVERSVYRAGSAYVESIVFDPFAGVFAPPACPPAEPCRVPTAETSAPVPAPPAWDVDDARPYAEVLREVEIRLLRRALHRCQFNQRKAAESLALTYHQFRGLYRKYQDALQE